MTVAASDTAPTFATVTASDVTRRFGDRRNNAVMALDHVTMSVDTGQSIGIVGESGSGKSTLARLLVGLESPSSGKVEFNGMDVARLTPRQRSEFRRRVQFVAQDTTSSFDPRRSLRESLRLPLRRLRGLRGTEADSEIGSALELLSLPAFLAERHPHQVSGGQRQRFALARAMVVRPRILVCDEVVSALDVSVQGSILNMLKRYCRDTGSGLVFVSHGLPATAFVSKHLVVMYRGQIVEQGATHRVITQPEHSYTAELLAAHSGEADSRRPVRATAVEPSPAQASHG